MQSAWNSPGAATELEASAGRSSTVRTRVNPCTVPLRLLRLSEVRPGVVYSVIESHRVEGKCRER